MQNAGTAKRVIFLVDMNAFFISCEASRNPGLRGRPAAVAGDPKKRTGIILAASYEARAFGVKTTMLLHEALKLCPKLLVVPPDHAFYEEKSRAVMALLSKYTPVLEQNSIDEAYMDMTGSEMLLGLPADIARHIMDEINDSLGLWCSIGIAGNKFLAKMASEIKKPQGITELWPEDLPGKLWPLPAASMIGVGRRTAEKLASVGLCKIGDLAKADEAVLEKLLGKFGREISLRARGIDEEPVLSHDGDLAKSIGRSTTLPADIVDYAQARLVLMELADDIARSARRQDQKGHTVQITLKYADFTVITRQVSIPATNITQEVFEAGCRLLLQNWSAVKPVRLIGISLSGFDDAIGRQVSLFEQTDSPSPADNRKARVDEAMDHIRDKLGEDSVLRAALMKKDRTVRPGRQPPKEGLS